MLLPWAMLLLLQWDYRTTLTLYGRVIFILFYFILRFQCISIVFIIFPHILFPPTPDVADPHSNSCAQNSFSYPCTLAFHVDFSIPFYFCQECYWSIMNIKMYWARFWLAKSRQLRLLWDTSKFMLSTAAHMEFKEHMAFMLHAMIVVLMLFKQMC